MTRASDAYDVVIIGAGIGGLVCGCYLAKAGMKVLIAEQHFKPGGYCTSFTRGGFTFDAAAHSFGGFKYGQLGKVFEELKLFEKIEIKQFNPANTVITPDYTISFWSELNRTVEECQSAFPDESANIKKFFYALVDSEPAFTAKIRNFSFQRLLDQFFINDKLKAIISMPLFGNAGLPPAQISAFLGVRIFKEFVLDGGCYPASGMQTLSNSLVEVFKEHGGELLLSALVDKIIVQDKKVNGITIKERGFIPAKCVVSNCDARQTFLKLLGKKIIDPGLFDQINSMVSSPSMFILYLGIEEAFDKEMKPGTNVWMFSQYDLEGAYRSIEKMKADSVNEYLLHLSPDNKRVMAFRFAPFKTLKYWARNKEKWSESLMRQIEIDALPDLSRHIICKEAATPHTLHQYTLNYRGAAYGWAGTPSQLVVAAFRRPSIQGLYLTGHWTTQGLGIPGVAYIGYETARMICRKEKGIRSSESYAKLKRLL